MKRKPRRSVPAPARLARTRSPALIAVLLLAGLLAPAAAARAQDSPGLSPKAIELSIAGSLVAVEGTVTGTALTSATGFTGLGSGLAGLGVEIGYTHVSSLDLLDLAAVLSWQHRIGESSVYPGFALAGGLRQEWLGSFATARYPVGANLGIRALAGHRAAFRAEYRFRRVLGDPVADFTEHQIALGVSLLLNNRP